MQTMLLIPPEFINTKEIGKDLPKTDIELQIVIQILILYLIQVQEEN